MQILDPSPESHYSYASVFPQPQSFSHSRKGSYPNNPNLTLTGGGGGPMAMLGGIHKRSGSDLSVGGGGGGGMGAVGVGLVDGEGYDNGRGGERRLWDGADEIELFPSNQLGGGGTLNHSVPSSVPSHHNSSSDQHNNPSYAHLTRQDQLLYSSHSHSSSSISPPSAHNSSTHSRGSSISSSASSHSQSHSLPHSRSGSISGLGSMMIEPSSSFQPQGGSGYHEYAPSSLQMDVHSHVEGTLPPSAMNFSSHSHSHSHSQSNSSTSSVIVPSQRTSASPPRHALRARSSSNRTSQAQPRGATRGAGSSAAQLAIDDEEGLVVPEVLVEEGENQRAMGKEADKDKAKMGFADFWLRASYSSSEKSTVSRQALFHSYNISCENLGLKAVNSASFGKAVRATFLGIQTRRLGVRGNSKYHYCGIRPNSKYEQRNLALFGDGTGGTHWTEPTDSSSASASGSEVEMSEGSEQEQEDSDAVGSDDEGDDEEGGGGGMQTDEDQVSFDSLGADLKRSHSMAALRTPSQKAFDDLKTPTAASHASSSNNNNNSNNSQPTFEPQPPTFLSNLQPKHPSPTLVQAPPPPQTKPRSNSNSASTNRARRHTTSSSFPVPPSTSVVSLPGYPSLFDAGPLPSNTPPGRAARSVWIKFNAHLDALMEAVRNLRFDVFELNLRTFWQLPEDDKEVCHAPSLAGIMARAETIVFDAILEHLKAQTLSPIPPATIASLRSLSLNLEQILVASLEAYGPSFAEPKVELGARFGHLLLRFLDIYQISSALATLLSNETAVRDINKTFETIDFDSIRNHVALVCNCRPDQLVQILEVELRQLLKDIAYSSAAQNQNPNRGGATLEDSLASGVRAVQQLMRWADSTADRLLAAQAREAEGQGKTASPRGILIRWSFVTSEIMRDLTIRSDPSFGSFQILKIAFDEWIGFKVLRMVALSTTSVAASVDSVAQQTFFALSPLVEDSFSQHPSTTQNYHPSMARNNLILEPFPHHQDLQQRRAFASGSQAHRSGRSRASSSSSSAYDPTLGGFQQPPRPSQYDSSRSNTFGQQLQPSYAQQQPAPALHVEMVGGGGGRYDVGTPSMYFADSPATESLVGYSSNPVVSSYSTPGSTTLYGNDPMGMGDLQKMVEGQHLGGGGGMEVESKGW